MLHSVTSWDSVRLGQWVPVWGREVDKAGDLDKLLKSWGVLKEGG